MTEEKNSTPNSKGILGYSLVIAAGIAIACVVYFKSEKDYNTALERYENISEKEVSENALKITNAFNQLYQGIRTISFLPSIKSIDRYGKNLDANAH